ncbi:MAG: phosphoglycerate mutase family protein [bacterium]|nr:phosphoglycerate mutase family protein [bacterium]
MTELLLIRHGQSQAQSGDDLDQVNPALSARGQLQAGRVAGVLAAFKPELVVVSPLRRAWQTYIVRVVFDSRIAEGNWGNPEFYAGIQPVRTPDFGAPDMHAAWKLPAEQRAAALLNDMLACGIARIAIVGHWGIFRELFRVFCADGQASMVTVVATMDNCAVARLAVDERGTRVIHAWNERAHVADLLE